MVVLAGSLGTTHQMWYPQLPALAERFRVVRYDHRGHGLSAVPPGPYTIDQLGGDLLALLDRLGVERASLCGLSLGGMVAMWLASEAPERVDRLALCSTSPKLGTPASWHELAAKVRAEGTGAIREQRMQLWFTPGFRAEHPEVVARFGRMLEETPDDGYAGCCEAIASMDLRERLGSIGAPTVVIAGADDPSTPPDHARLIAGLIPGARLEIFPDAAHLISAQRPVQVNETLLEHLG